MARVLLLLPSGTYKAPDFLAAAARLGVDVVVASEAEQTLSQAMGDRAVVVDLCDTPGSASTITDLDARYPVDAVVAVDDQGVVIAAQANRRLGLPANDPEAVARTRDKAALRAALESSEVRQPAFRVVSGPDEVVAAGEQLGWPVVVKPVSLSASRGVIRADGPGEADAAACRIRAILDGDGHPPGEPLLVESYVAGREVALEGLLRGGELEVLALFDKPDPLTGPFFEETIYVTPSRLPETVQADVIRTVAEAAAAIGLTEGPVHGELRVDDEGRPWLLEVAARTIGGLCARTLRFAAGVTLEEIVLRHALGLPVDPRRERPAAGVMMLPIPAAGRLVAVHGQDEARAVPGITALEISIHPGGTVVPLPEGDRYLGFLFARGPSPADVEHALRAAHAHLEVEITP